ncbi:probable alkaline/neutral invertase D [Tanacetum coccineum]|uniref:Alkaline/neutral invertase n=1 Tax=Tanacetum coccineum TaxID=301880 RepID=A0ABQ5IZ83_9ASTR
MFLLEKLRLEHLGHTRMDKSHHMSIGQEVLYSYSKVKEYSICHFGYDSLVSQKPDPHLLVNLNDDQMALRSFVAEAAVTGVVEARAKIFGHVLNPTDHKTGNKILRQPIIGKKVVAWYPPDIRKEDPTTVAHKEKEDLPLYLEWAPDDILSEDPTYKKDENDTSISGEQEVTNYTRDLEEMQSLLRDDYLASLRRKEIGLRNVSSIPEMDDFELTSFWIDQGLPSKERNHLMRGGRSGLDTLASSIRNSFEPRPMIAESWDYLRKSLVRGQPVGRIAAYDQASEKVLNYDQLFVRAFVPSAVAFLMNVLEIIVLRKQKRKCRRQVIRGKLALVDLAGSSETGLRNVSSVCSIPEMDDFELTKLLDRPRLTIKRDKSFDERSLSDMSISRGLDNLDIAYSPGGRSVSTRWYNCCLYDHASEEVLNYDQDFVPSAMAFLMNGEPDIVKNFLLKTLLHVNGKHGRYNEARKVPG